MGTAFVVDGTRGAGGIVLVSVVGSAAEDEAFGGGDVPQWSHDEPQHAVGGATLPEPAGSAASHRPVAASVAWQRRENHAGTAR